MVVKDLATKKQVTIHIPADAQMKKLPDNMAQMLATRLKGAAEPAVGGGAAAQVAEAVAEPGRWWSGGPGRRPGGADAAIWTRSRF